MTWLRHNVQVLILAAIVGVFAFQIANTMNASYGERPAGYAAPGVSQVEPLPDPAEMP